MLSLKRWIVPLVCLATLALVSLACQLASPTDATPTVGAPATEGPPAEATPATEGAPALTAEAYPQPYPQPYPVTSLEPYPNPEPAQTTPLVPTTAAVLYPGIESGAEVLWEQAVAMILNGEVTQVTQTHDLKVYLILKDGRSFSTTEPAIDDVMRIVDFCGEPCKDILVATE